MTSKLRLLFLVFSVKAQNSYWLPAGTASKINSSKAAKKSADVFFILDLAAFEKAIVAAEKTGGTVYFPSSKGVLEAYKISAQDIFSSDLAVQFPDIKSFKGFKQGGSGAQLFFALSKKGLSLTGINTLTAAPTYFIEKVQGSDLYTIYTKNEVTEEKDFICKTIDFSAAEKSPSWTQGQAAKTTIKTYRLAVSASGEYTQYHGGTVAGALAAINATVTRVNALFGKDLGLQLQLIAETANIIYTDPETDPYTTDLNAEVQQTITANIGADNYDIGHLFHKGNNNGNAGFVGAVCQNNKKGSAFSSGQFPEGDTYDIDFVAHEMGHQFGAFHTWSYEFEGTDVQVEPGSGSTVMSYAGIVSGENVAANASDYFHAVSILQIGDYLDNFGCETNEQSNNEPPQISPIPSYNLPLATPFVLEGEATDPDSLGLSFAWEQGDSGVVTAAVFGPENPTGAAFRSLEPTQSSKRYFPKLSNVLTNNLTSNLPQNTQWETLATVPRDYIFYLTVRDNEPSGAGVAIDKTSLKVLPNVGPFVINSLQQPISFTGGESVELQWEVARTNGPELNTQWLTALLSIDGGLSFTETLAENILNDGAVILRLPNRSLPKARIMLKADNNPFFALNQADFSITANGLSLFFTKTDMTLCLGESLALDAQLQYSAVPQTTPTIGFEGLPAGLSAMPVLGAVSETFQDLKINFNATNTLQPGSYSVTTLMNYESQVFSTTYVVRVLGGTLEAPLLQSPSNGAAALFIDQNLEWSAVAGATSYEVQMSKNANFDSLIWTKSTKFNTIYLNNLEAENTYYWRVKPINSCSISVFSEAFSFSTAAVNCLTKTATFLPKIIGSDDPNTIEAIISFDEDLPLSSLEVSLDISHSYLSDLLVKLYAPSGKSVVLISNSCGASQDILATFSQTASAFVCGDNLGISGLVQPLGNFETFKGASIQGNWRLEIQDVAAIDGGSLNAFSIKACVAGNFRPDADGDGVYDDGDDQCLNTPQGVKVDTKGCAVYRLSDRNFSIGLKSQTCVNTTDGMIEVKAAAPMNYQVSVQNALGNTVRQSSFTSNYQATGLVAGTYEICMRATDGAIVYETQCATVVIAAPQPLAVLSAVGFSGGQLFLNLSGSEQYFISLNKAISTHRETQVKLDLKEGLNTLKVSTGLDCQGVYEELIYYTPKPSVYPNPVRTQLFIQTPSFKDPHMKVQVFRLSGALLTEINTQASSAPFAMDTSGWKAGVYVISVWLDGLQTNYKVLKE